LHRLLEEKYHGRPLQGRRLVDGPDELAKAIIARVNTSSALWQQFGGLCDLILVSDQSGEAEYYEELPLTYVHDSPWGQHEHYYLVTLEYGAAHDVDDPFNRNRIALDDVDHAEQSNALHPVVRRYAGSTLVAVHHVIEDFANDWVEDIHVQPLL